MDASYFSKKKKVNFRIMNQENILFSFYCFVFIAYGAVRIIERLFSSALIALVSVEEPRRLRVCDFKKGIELSSDLYTSTILAVKLNRLVK